MGSSVGAGREQQQQPSMRRHQVTLNAACCVRQYLRCSLALAVLKQGQRGHPNSSRHQRGGGSSGPGVAGQGDETRRLGGIREGDEAPAGSSVRELARVGVGVD